MSMEIVHTENGERRTETFPMNHMEKGQVCYCPEHKHYVLRVTHMGDTIFLILDNHNSVNSFGYGCTEPVRSLLEGESITIEFS